MKTTPIQPDDSNPTQKHRSHSKCNAQDLTAQLHLMGRHLKVKLPVHKLPPKGETLEVHQLVLSGSFAMVE